MSLEAVEANLMIRIEVYCPNCEAELNLLDEDDTNGVAHNDEGNLMQQAFPDLVPWSRAHPEFKVSEVQCSECREIFNVKG